MIILKLPLQSMIGNIRQFISETKGNQFYSLQNIQLKYSRSVNLDGTQA